MYTGAIIAALIIVAFVLVFIIDRTEALGRRLFGRSRRRDDDVPPPPPPPSV